MKQTTRRQILTMTALSATASAIGCNTSTVTDPVVKSIDSTNQSMQDALDSSSNEELKRYKIALRGYQIVSMFIAGRVVFLPYPGMRILSAVILATSVVAKLSVEYIDDELIMRRIEESLTERERSVLEADRYIPFTTESGISTKEYLAPTTYTNDN